MGIFFVPVEGISLCACQKSFIKVTSSHFFAKRNAGCVCGVVFFCKMYPPILVFLSVATTESQKKTTLKHIHMENPSSSRWYHSWILSHTKVKFDFFTCFSLTLLFCVQLSQSVSSRQMIN